MPREYATALKDWVVSNPIVREWFNKKAAGSKNTALGYASYLHRYWRDSLAARGYRSVDQWVEEVREQQDSRDVKVKRQWGKELETFYQATDLMRASRFHLTQSVKSFLMEQIDPLAKYKFTLVSRDERVAEERAKQEVAPLTTEELRTLALKASTRDKAIILTQVSAGFGVGEMIVFAKEWKLYEKEIREKQVPIKIKMVRPKTGRAYWTLLWDDAVEALNALLIEREGSSKLFVNQHGGAIEEQDIQLAVRRLAERTGLEVKGSVKRHSTHRIRPHEFRDYLKTTCENGEVPNTISEFLLGHKIDPLEYNKFAKTREGEERIRSAIIKVRPQLNIITGRGLVKREESYLDTVVESWSIVNGMDSEEVKKMVVYMVKRLNPEVIRQGLQKAIADGWYKGEGMIDDMLNIPPEGVVEEVVRRLSKEQLRPAIIQMAKDRQATQSKGKRPEQKVIHETELEQYLGDGWSFRSVINSEKVLVERDAA